MTDCDPLPAPEAEPAGATPKKTKAHMSGLDVALDLLAFTGMEIIPLVAKSPFLDFNNDFTLRMPIFNMSIFNGWLFCYLSMECSTAMMTFPFFCPVSTYLCASAVCSNG